MLKPAFLLFTLLLVSRVSFGQDLNLDELDVVLHDTLISKADFLENTQKMPPARLASLQFRPPSNGPRTVYYLNGKVYAQGEIDDKKETGVWTYWHRNGTKARQGRFVQGRREGIHTYWYENGNLRGTGSFRHDQYDGKWTMYKEDGKQAVEQTYKDGKLVGKE